MTELTCENVCLAAMAMIDGLEPSSSSELIEAHLLNCPGCRLEVEELKVLAGLLDSQSRREQTLDMWSVVKRRLPDAAPLRAASKTWHAFLFLGLLLLGYKLVEMIPERDLGVFFKLVPLLIVIAVFSYLKENPFKINAELRLEGE